jgi:hypothetical protein
VLEKDVRLLARKASTTKDTKGHEGKTSIPHFLRATFHFSMAPTSPSPPFGRTLLRWSLPVSFAEYVVVFTAMETLSLIGPVW